MKFKKVIINGETFYQELPAEDTTIVEDEVIDPIVEEEPEETLNDPVNDKKEDKEDTKEGPKEEKNSRIDFNDIMGNIFKEVKSGFNQMGDFIDRSFNPKSKTSKFLRILPFMEEDDIHEIVNKIFEDDAEFKDLNLAEIMPFLSDEDCDRVFMRALDNNVSNPMSMIHFVSEDCLTKLVDKYIEGKYPKLDSDKLYPFLKSEDVKRIFYYELKK